MTDRLALSALLVLLLIALDGIFSHPDQNALMLPQFLTDLCHPIPQLSQRILKAGLFIATGLEWFGLRCFLLRIVVLRTELGQRSFLPELTRIGYPLQLRTAPVLILLADLRRALGHNFIAPIVLHVDIGVDHVRLPLAANYYNDNETYNDDGHHSWLIIPFSLRYFISFRACSLPFIYFTSFVFPCSCRIFNARFR